MDEKFKRIYYSNDGYIGEEKRQYKNYLKHQVQQKKKQKMATETAIVSNIFTTSKICS